MTIVRRITTAVGGLLVPLLLLAGLGIGLAAWLQSWHGDYVAAVGQSEAAGNVVLQDMLDSLSSRAHVMTIVMVIVTVVAVAPGIAATVLLGRMIGRQVRGAMVGIGDSAAELLAVASQVAAATAQTAAATTETTATVEEVKQTAMLAQEKAAEASELSHQLAERCDYGAASARQNFGEFERIQADMDVVAEAIDRLNEQIESVGEITTTVNDLAEQSNLLSVNASIEAAKAGEHGKGFAVVAQEVKSLAEQSKQAVGQVRTVLSEIQKASDVAVRAAAQSRGAVETGRAEAGRGIENTEAEQKCAAEAAEATAQISATSRQQLTGMEQIRQAIMSISEAGSQSVAGTQQVEREAGQLQDLALSLQSLVDAHPAQTRRKKRPKAASD